MFSWVYAYIIILYYFDAYVFILSVSFEIILNICKVPLKGNCLQWI